MQAVMMARQHTTPPTLEIEEFVDLSYTAGSASSVFTYLDQDWSPQSTITAASTPPARSPRFKDSGPQLLPKVRAQDKVMPCVPAVSRHLGHTRTQSLPCTNGYPVQPGHLHPLSYAAQMSGDFFDFATPASVPPAQTMLPANGVYDFTIPQRLSAPVTAARTHSRNTSTGSIDASLVNKYCYPTYRQSPTPQPPGLSCTADALSHLTPMAMLGATPVSYQARSRTVSPQSRPRVSTAMPSTGPQGQSCLRSYLTKANPAPQPLQQLTVDRNTTDCFWWDVRNVYDWAGFNIDTILGIEGFLDLINCSVDETLLPEPGKVNLVPETRAHLAELCASHHLFKLNKALALSQGSNHLAAQALRAGPTSHKQPEFVSNYCSETEKTISGNGRGRVVGIARGFEEWNSGMRGNDPVKRIEYLRGLSALQKQMRDHGCRYGFIISEIELVCVRAGGPATPGRPPLFGYLELATPISMSTYGPAKDCNIQMTAGIALWYLHMLARDMPLPGQLDWRLNVGTSAAGTRQHHMKKDAWIPQPNQSEKRTAKRLRGWFMPDEPICSLERGRASRRRK